MNKNIIRIGDRVELIAPIRFIRCGYDLNFQDLKNKILSEDEALLEALALKYAEAKLDPNKRSRFVSKVSLTKMAGAFAYGLVGLNLKEGQVRRLFLEPLFDSKDSLRLWQNPKKNEKATVTAIKYVKTGIYHGCIVRYSYYEECDYEPAYLSKEKTHKVLKLEFDRGYSDEWVLAIHTRKLDK